MFGRNNWRYSITTIENTVSPYYFYIVVAVVIYWTLGNPYFYRSPDSCPRLWRVLKVNALHSTNRKQRAPCHECWNRNYRLHVALATAVYSSEDSLEKTSPTRSKSVVHVTKRGIVYFWMSVHRCEISYYAWSYCFPVFLLKKIITIRRWGYFKGGAK